MAAPTQVGVAGDAERQPLRARGTLRFRITALAVIVVATVLIITSVALVSAQHRLLEAQLDETIVDRADELMGEIAASGAWPPGLETTSDPDVAWQLIDPTWTVLEAGVELAGAPPVIPTDTVASDTGGIQTAGVDPEGFPYRLLVRRVDTPEGVATLVVAMDLEDVLASTRTLSELLALATPIVVVVLAILVWWLVGRTLRPVEAIRSEVARIGGTDLDRRVPQPAGDDEIARLARTMNAMLGRIQTATERQHRFVADASHELRTPITRMRTQLEVDVAHPEGRDEQASLRSALADTVALQALVGDLLDLARADSGAAADHRVEVDLDDVVLDEVRRIGEAGRVRVDASGVTAASVVGDRAALVRAIRNLMDNAERHATSAVTLTLSEDSAQVRLVVADDGPGVPMDQRERIFERFARLDDARSGSVGGTGLGLAITREIVQAHGGSVGVEPGGPGARFIVELPRAPDR